jgi:hypothetical protein
MHSKTAQDSFGGCAFCNCFLDGLADIRAGRHWGCQDGQVPEDPTQPRKPTSLLRVRQRVSTHQVTRYAFCPTCSFALFRHVGLPSNAAPSAWFGTVSKTGFCPAIIHLALFWLCLASSLTHQPPSPLRRQTQTATFFHI